VLLIALPTYAADEPDHAIHEELRAVLATMQNAINAGKFDDMLPVISQDVRATTITQEVISRGIYYRSSVCGQSNSCIVVAYFSASAFRSSVVTRVASAMMNAISLLVVMKRAPFLMYSTWRGR
jgi:hypothetical protein